MLESDKNSFDSIRRVMGALMKYVDSFICTQIPSSSIMELRPIGVRAGSVSVWFLAFRSCVVSCRELFRSIRRIQ